MWRARASTLFSMSPTVEFGDGRVDPLVALKDLAVDVDPDPVAAQVAAQNVDRCLKALSAGAWRGVPVGDDNAAKRIG